MIYILLIILLVLVLLLTSTKESFRYTRRYRRQTDWMGDKRLINDHSNGRFDGFKK